MVPINYVAIAVATVAAFLFSSAYYFVIRKKVAAIRGAYRGKSADNDTGMTFNKVVIELTRTFVVGLAMAYAVVNARNLTEAAIVVLWLWVAFPVVLLIGSIIHEQYPIRLAFIHAIDWMVKLLIFAMILTVWR